MTKLTGLESKQDPFRGTDLDDFRLDVIASTHLPTKFSGPLRHIPFKTVSRDDRGSSNWDDSNILCERGLFDRYMYLVRSLLK